MNRVPQPSPICTDFIVSIEDATTEVHERGWSIGHTAIEGINQVSGHKQNAKIVANPPTELDAWLLACVKANEQERLSLHRN